MAETVFGVRFLKSSKVRLARRQRVARWEPTEEATLILESSGLRVVGCWRLSWIGGGLVLLGALGRAQLSELIKELLLKPRAEVIAFDGIERLAIHTRKNTPTYHVFQRREDGSQEVHVFTVGQEVAGVLTESLKGVLPAGLVKEEAA